ncbi:MAG: hypothetical protein BME93_05310 [Methanosarcinales archaeon Met12]|nr:MAG: hypothetical protein BME93_05310 [Methanosarcinales archaeon Met12]
MAKEVLVIFDKVGNTLDVWFGEPKEAVCEETEEEFLIKKDIKTGEVIGFEKFNVMPEGEVPPVKVLIKTLYSKF